MTEYLFNLIVSPFLSFSRLEALYHLLTIVKVFIVTDYSFKMNIVIARDYIRSILHLEALRIFPIRAFRHCGLLPGQE